MKDVYQLTEHIAQILYISQKFASVVCLSEVGEEGKMPINEIYLHFKCIQIGTEPSVTS